MSWKIDSERGIDAVVNATGKTRSQVAGLVDHYRSLHWGIGPRRIVHIDDPLLPDCARMGALVGLYVIDGDGEHVSIELPETDSHLAVHEPTGRLFLVTPARVQDQIRKLYRQSLRTLDPVSLAELAREAPGHQNSVKPWSGKAWPDVDVIPLGVVTHILYHTDKKGDGPSTYIHAFGEESGQLPVLAADGTVGRLWLAGGDYTTPVEGITN